MISDASLWIDIGIESWHYIQGTSVVPVGGGYKLNGGTIDTTIELDGNQRTTQYGIIFAVSDLGNSNNGNYAQLAFYDERGDLLDAGLCYLPVAENGRVWTEIPTQKTFKVAINIHGNFTVTGIQLYAVASNIGDATYTEKGKVVVDKTAGMVVADGKIGVNVGDGITITSEGKLSTTSDVSGSNLQSVKFYTAIGSQGMCVNGNFFFAKVNGGMKFLNGDRLIPVTADTGGVAAAYEEYISYIASQGGGSSGSE